MMPQSKSKRCSKSQDSNSDPGTKVRELRRIGFFYQPPTGPPGNEIWEGALSGKIMATSVLRIHSNIGINRNIFACDFTQDSVGEAHGVSPNP